MKTILAVIALTASLASALCPNSCSGHGTCGANDACTCDVNFSGADCSQRICAFGLSFSDQPLGDLDHDGSVTTATATLSSGAISNGVLTHAANMPSHESFQGLQNHEAHFYAECSGKGDCNRESGECECFAGYTGSSCQRTTCPNDCSGHGRCRTIGEIATTQMNKVEATNAAEVVTYDGVTMTNSNGKLMYGLWDADKQQACVCDAGYSGADCTLRTCPRGDDPLTSGVRYNNGDSANEYDVFKFDLATTGTLRHQIKYTDAQGREHFGYTDYIDMANAAATDSPLTGASKAGAFTLAFRSIGPLQGATVDFASAPTMKVTLTNVGGTAQDRYIEVTSYNQATGAATALTVTLSTTTTIGNTEAVECSNRGLCDYTSGACSCFSGYSGVACEHQNALAGSGTTASTSTATITA